MFPELPASIRLTPLEILPAPSKEVALLKNNRDPLLFKYQFYAAHNEKKSATRDPNCQRGSPKVRAGDPLSAFFCGFSF